MLLFNSESSQSLMVCRKLKSIWSRAFRHLPLSICFTVHNLPFIKLAVKCIKDSCWIYRELWEGLTVWPDSTLLQQIPVLSHLVSCLPRLSVWFDFPWRTLAVHWDATHVTLLPNRFLLICPPQVVPWQARPNHCRGAAAPGPEPWQLPHQGEWPPARFLCPVFPQYDQRGQPFQVRLWTCNMQKWPGRDFQSVGSVSFCDPPSRHQVKTGHITSLSKGWNREINSNLEALSIFIYFTLMPVGEGTCTLYFYSLCQE